MMRTDYIAVRTDYIAVLTRTHPRSGTKYRRVKKYALIRVLARRKKEYSGVWWIVEPVTLEELRCLQKLRVDRYRPELITRLQSYGATGLYNLDEKYYRKYKRFLLTLKP